MRCFLPFTLLLFSCCRNISENVLLKNDEAIVAESDEGFEKRLDVQTERCRRFIKLHQQYNQQTGFVVDMRIPSSHYRFFVIDFNTGKIVY
jgi:hypothetical protein